MSLPANYTPAVPECDAAVISKTTAVTISADANSAILLGLQISAAIGLVGSAALLGLAIWWQSLWTGIMAVFLGQRCLISFRQSKGLFALGRIPRHTGFACPSCHEAPPGGPIWVCQSCQNRFDPFSTRAVCPHCQAVQATTPCPHCGDARPFSEWQETGGRVGGFR